MFGVLLCVPSLVINIEVSKKRNSVGRQHAAPDCKSIMEWLKSVHFYRKVPADLTEATLAGGTISLLSSLAMAYLFVSNFRSFLQIETVTSVRLDESQEKKIQINFNVTLHHLPCRFASVDIADVMGTHLQNVSANIVKTRCAAAPS